MNEIPCFDYIIVGGGSAGCVLANRLSEDANVSVLLIEAGPDHHSPLIKLPTGAVTMVPTRYNNWAFDTVPQSHLKHRKGYQPRGKVLGGSSAINAMVYIRGHKDDYNDWADLGWGWNDVLPYFIKSENNKTFSDTLHGNQGPLSVENSRSNNPIADAFVKAGVQAGYPLNTDFNSNEQFGIGRYQVTQRNGQRCSAAAAYIDPVRYRNNLTLWTSKEVERVLLKDGECYGVQLSNGVKVLAEKEVILSAGAIKSPQLLMLSGIGPRQKLQQHGIDCLIESPGVGENLQDHIDYVSAFKSTSYKLFGLSFAGLVYMSKQLFKYMTKRKGLLSSNFAETGGFVKSHDSKSRPDVQFHFVIATVRDHARDWRSCLMHGYSLHTCILRPKSRGRITLASADPLLAPKIDPQFLAHSDDQHDMLNAVKVANKILRQSPLKQFQHTSLNDDQNLSDEQLLQKIREYADTVYHPVGTCKMGHVDDKTSVVDNKLRVIGCKNLRVVDASIFPNLIGGNTNAPTIMVAERASDFIKNAQL